MPVNIKPRTKPLNALKPEQTKGILKGIWKEFEVQTRWIWKEFEDWDHTA